MVQKGGKRVVQSRSSSVTQVGYDAAFELVVWLVKDRTMAPLAERQASLW